MNAQSFATIKVVGSILVALVIVGCQSSTHEAKGHWNAQSIESFRSVAGKWAGIMVRAPKAPQDDWVRVTISDDGHYEFSSVRMIGVFSGQGQFTLADGKLTVTTERGAATGTLWVTDGRRMLRFLGRMKDGTDYTVELVPSD